mgnify:CR=1 FL=1
MPSWLLALERTRFYLPSNLLYMLIDHSGERTGLFVGAQRNSERTIQSLRPVTRAPPTALVRWPPRKKPLSDANTLNGAIKVQSPLLRQLRDIVTTSSLGHIRHRPVIKPPLLLPAKPNYNWIKSRSPVLYLALCHNVPQPVMDGSRLRLPAPRKECS